MSSPFFPPVAAPQDVDLTQIGNLLARVRFLEAVITQQAARTQYVEYTPDFVLESSGSGITQPTIVYTDGWICYPPDGVQEFDPVFGLFTVGISDPGTLGTAGTGQYRVSTGPDAVPITDGVMIGQAMLSAFNQFGVQIEYPLAMIGNDDGFAGLVVTSANIDGSLPGPGSTQGVQPIYPEVLDGAGFSSFTGFFHFPAAA